MAEKIVVAFAGNPNSGKTTLFNSLTGSRHSVGNWPGVTVERKEGKIKSTEADIIAVDLPGTYSLSPYSIEEIVARNYIVEGNPDVVINIVDASNIERNLYLTTQLIELGKPIIIALNMMDVAEKRGMKVDVAKLSGELGVPVIPIVATKNEGLKDLIAKIIEVKSDKRKAIPNQIDYGTKAEERIAETMAQLEDNPKADKSNLRWLAIKVLEEDEAVLELLGLEASEYDEDAFSSEIDMEDDLESVIADKKYSYISKVVGKSVKKPKEKMLTTSDKVDKIVTNKWLGLPIFGALMYLVFWLTFNIGDIFNMLIDEGFGTLAESLKDVLGAAGVAEWLQSLIGDGIIAGVGGVLTFLPNIIFLFIAISILEDSGYMARVAFIMDRAMRKIGLSGKAFVPLIMGFGCTVPAIMGARTLEDENDRLATILVSPFMSCGARLPIYILFAGIFFPGRQSIVVFSLYVLGILVAIASALLFKKTIFKSKSTPFVMELPPYRVPTFKVTGVSVWQRVKGYLLRAGTIIFAASILIWFITGYNFTGAVELNESFGASIGRFIAPIFKPLGFGNWQSTLSLITGLLAKEVIISTMAIIYGLGEIVGEAAIEGDVLGFSTTLRAVGFNMASAYAFMVFALLYTPCVAVIGVTKRETNSWKWTLFAIAYQSLVAWGIGFVVYQIGMLLI